MTQKTQFGDWSDDRLIAEYRRLKEEMSGQDPRFVPGDEGPIIDIILAEMDERGLTPDREDVVPERHSDDDAPEGTTPRP